MSIALLGIRIRQFFDAIGPESDPSLGTESLVGSSESDGLGEEAQQNDVSSSMSAPTAESDNWQLASSIELRAETDSSPSFEEEEGEEGEGEESEGEEEFFESIEDVPALSVEEEVAPQQSPPAPTQPQEEPLSLHVQPQEEEQANPQTLGVVESSADLVNALRPLEGGSPLSPFPWQSSKPEETDKSLEMEEAEETQETGETGGETGNTPEKDMQELVKESQGGFETESSVNDNAMSLSEHGEEPVTESFPELIPTTEVSQSESPSSTDRPFSLEAAELPRKRNSTEISQEEDRKKQRTQPRWDTTLSMSFDPKTAFLALHPPPSSPFAPTPQSTPEKDFIVCSSFFFFLFFFSLTIHSF